MCRSSEADVEGMEGVEGGEGAAGGGVVDVGRACVKKLQKSVAQLGLFLFFVVYTAVGAKIFQELEHPEEVAAHREASSSLLQQRASFLQALLNISSPSITYRTEEASAVLMTYEEAMTEAMGAGVSPLHPTTPHYHWNYIESVFFASTVITTIGYGNMAPVTVLGRVFCILYGLVGIPVTLSLISDLGSLFANVVLAVYQRVKQCVPRVVQWLEESVREGGRSRGLVVLGAVVALLLYISVGGGLFILWEDWTFFEAFYFCFITMTTIGLGDLVPERTEFMLVCNLYILIGLALTSTIIELVRRQYAESWQHMKELSGKLGELSGPLAEHLRKIGEHAGDLNIDVHLMKDLKDLRSIINLSKIEALSRLDPKFHNDVKIAEILKAHLERDDTTADLALPEATEKQPLHPTASKKRKVIQVVIYESSV